MFISCECCVLASRVVCDELITRPESVLPTVVIVVCDLETSNEEAMARFGPQRYVRGGVISL
jgi:hypothetical protein